MYDKLFMLMCFFGMFVLGWRTARVGRQEVINAYKTAFDRLVVQDREFLRQELEKTLALQKAYSESLKVLEVKKTNFIN